MPRTRKIPTLFMETTKITPESTSADIIQMLVRMNANQVSCTYDQSRSITGIQWVLLVEGRPQCFQMPVRVEPVRAYLKKAGRLPSSDPTKPNRVAWRQLLRWIEAQCALIETGMVQPAEPFVGYAFDPQTNRTLFQAWTAQLAFPAPEGMNQ
jgi:hypothetical protein